MTAHSPRLCKFSEHILVTRSVVMCFRGELPAQLWAYKINKYHEWRKALHKWQLQRNFTMETTTSLWEQQLHCGNNNFTVGTTISLWKQQLHCGNNNFTVETTTSLWEQQFHLGNGNFTTPTAYHTTLVSCCCEHKYLHSVEWEDVPAVYQLIPIFHSIPVFIAAWSQLKNWHYDVMTAENLTLWRDGSWRTDTMTWWQLRTWHYDVTAAEDLTLWLSCCGYLVKVSLVKGLTNVCVNEN